MPKKPTKCPYCASGQKPDQKGEHWIAKRFGVIVIKRCKDAPKAEPRP